MYNPRKDYPKNQKDFEILMKEIDNEFIRLEIPIENREVNVGILLSKWLGYKGHFSPDMNLVNNDIFTGDSLRAKTIHWYDKMYGDKQLIDNKITSVPIKIKGNYYSLDIPIKYGNIQYTFDKKMLSNESPNYCNIITCIKNITKAYIDTISNDEAKDILIFSINCIESLNWLNDIIKKNKGLHPLFEIALKDYYSSSDSFFNKNLTQSAWFSQQALEKIIKAFLSLGGFTYPKNNRGHDLVALINILNNNLNINIENNLIEASNLTPSVRYGEVSIDINMVYNANISFLNFLHFMKDNKIVEQYIAKNK